MWRVDGRTYNVSDYSEDVVMNVYRKWHRNNSDIECLCHSNNGYYPILGIRPSKNGVLHAFNHPKNKRYNLEHAAFCPFNTKRQEYLKKKGIKIENGKLICKLKKKRKQNKKKTSSGDVKVYTSPQNTEHKSVSSSSSSLRFFFLNILERYSIHRFIPGQTRNVFNRIFKACCESVINGEDGKKIVYLVNSKFNYDFRKHKLIIGWGKKSLITKDGDFFKIPMFSIDSKRLVYEHRIPHWVYDEATFTQASVDQGYFVIWRDQLDKSSPKLKDLELIFVPAETNTMIPVESSLEERMIRFLLEKNKEFTKPLVMDKEELLRPDFIVDDGQTIIEVAGLLEKEEYQKRLEEKKRIYKKQNKRYIEWDGKTDLGKLDI